jgi:hypothetical protein
MSRLSLVPGPVDQSHGAAVPATRTRGTSTFVSWRPARRVLDDLIAQHTSAATTPKELYTMSARTLARAASATVVVAGLAIAPSASAKGSSGVDNPSPITTDVGPVVFPLSSLNSPLHGQISMAGNRKKAIVSSTLTLSSDTAAVGHVDNYSCAGDICTYVSTQSFRVAAGSTATILVQFKALNIADYPYVQQLVFDDAATKGVPEARYDNVLFPTQDVPSWPTMYW